jgi:hypothetical protein
VLFTSGTVRFSKKWNFKRCLATRKVSLKKLGQNFCHKYLGGLFVRMSLLKTISHDPHVFMGLRRGFNLLLQILGK